MKHTRAHTLIHAYPHSTGFFEPSEDQLFSQAEIASQTRRIDHNEKTLSSIAAATSTLARFYTCEKIRAVFSTSCTSSSMDNWQLIPFNILEQQAWTSFQLRFVRWSRIRSTSCRVKFIFQRRDVHLTRVDHPHHKNRNINSIGLDEQPRIRWEQAREEKNCKRRDEIEI